MTIERMSVLSAKRGQRVMLHLVLRSPPGLSGDVSVCATPAAAVAEPVCRSIRRPFGASGKIPFSLPLTINATAPIGTMLVAISATAGTSSAKTTALLRIVK